MRKSLVGAALVLATAAPLTAHAAPELFAGLSPGPHAVGFRQIERLDRSRLYWMPRGLDGEPRRGERARPLRISVWYPARPTTGPALSVADYAALMAVEDRLGPVTPALARAGQRAFFAVELVRDLDAAQRERLLRMRGIAHRDARPAPGRFPLVLYSLGSAATGHVTPELLASHGYVVAQAPRLGAYAGLAPNGGDLRDLLTKDRDLDQVLNAVAAEHASADPTRIAAIGFSAGGRWALQLAMRNPHVRAVVSLDSVFLFDDAVASAWRTHPEFDLEAVRVPVLHAIRKEWVPREDARIWRGMRHAERLALRFEDPALDHMDFQSAGLAQTLAGGRAPYAASVRAAFALWNRYALAFLDAHVRRDAAARRFLARSPEQNGAASGKVVASRLAAQPAPLRSADLFNAMAEKGAVAALAAFRRAGERGKPALAEADLVSAGYSLLFTPGRERDGVRVFELLVATYPRSANAHDSLADACLATGDRRRARVHTERAHQLLASDRSIPAGRRASIQKSIDDKRERLR